MNCETNSALDRLRENAANLFRYLKDLVGLRNRTITDLASYEESLWFSEIPHEPECFTPAWQWGENTEDEGTWLRIDKPSRPAVPQPPVICDGWFDPDSLEQVANEPQLIKERVVFDAPNESATGDEDEEGKGPGFTKLSLADHPEVERAWQKYVTEHWSEWRREYQRYAAVFRAYQSLFAIHQELQKGGERLELLFGIGVLFWQFDEKRVCRPLITARVSLALEKSGTLELTPALEGADFTLETDMLDAGELPHSAELQTEVERQIHNLESPWDRSLVMSALRQWGTALSSKTELSEALALPERSREFPQIVAAPVLILRKRAGRALFKAMEQVAKTFEEGQAVPECLGQVCGISRDLDRHRGNGTSLEPTEDLLFPLPTNEQQCRIVRELEWKSGVLVQGPPGTGKSHTIANLISHLLAQGKRILVTSQTPRALQVLREKIPEEIRPLSISLLGDDAKSRSQLEQAVNGIQRKQSAWDADVHDAEIRTLHAERKKCRSEISSLQRRLRELREFETRQYTIPGTNYQGTAQQIAIQLRCEASDFDWFKDHIAESATPTVSNDEVRKLCEFWSEHLSDPTDLLSLEIAAISQIPSPLKFASLVQSFNQTKHCLAELQSIASTQPSKSLLSLSSHTLTELKDKCGEAKTLRAELLLRNSPWRDHALADFFGGRESQWLALIKPTEDAINDLQSKIKLRYHVDAELPVGISLERLLADSVDLDRHLSAGKGFGFWVFRSDVVKRTRYLWTDFRFNGRLVTTEPSVLKSLIESLSDELLLKRLWLEWEAQQTSDSAAPIKLPNGTFRLRLAALAEELATLHSCRRFFDLCSECYGRIDRALPNPNATPLSSFDWAERLGQEIDIVLASRNHRDAETTLLDSLNELSRILPTQKPHPSVAKLRDAATRFDADGYQAAVGEMIDFVAKKRHVEQALALDRRLREITPQFAKELRTVEGRDFVERHLDRLTEAWNWRRAQSWLDRFGREHDEQDLSEQIRRHEKQLAELTTKLAASMAWLHCLNNLTSAQLSALSAWKLSQDRDIGKGKATNIETYRREARENLQICKTVIRSWIMPFHLVAEQIAMQPESFDVVIVDEASQTGPEGVLLLLLAKKCVIVGDDKQISPDAIGFNKVAVDTFARKWLQGISQPQTLRPHYSLFDQATVRFGVPITLTEHFRCMPEIIRFSNELCYAPNGTPLQPLLQYPPNRLPPIMVRHVTDGFREGERDKVINRSEAQCIVKAVIDCLSDPRYDGKTMGVIALQGHAQAKLIEQMLLESVGTKPFSERQLVCGDPYSFQGNERHIMFLSMVAALEGETRVTALTRYTYQQRFNVAASRAQEQMWLFHSIERDDLHPECMRRRLLEHCYNPAELVTECDLAKCESKFERDVAEILMQHGFRVVPQFEIAGRRIDLVVEGLRSRLAVECDGDEWHGPDRWEADMARQRMLERCKLVFERIRGSVFYANRNKAMQPVFTMLEKMGIKPASVEPLDANPVRDWVSSVNSQDCPLPKQTVPIANLASQRGRRQQVTLFDQVESNSVSNSMKPSQAPPPPVCPAKTSFKGCDLEVAVLNIVKEATSPVLERDIWRKVVAMPAFVSASEEDVSTALAFWRGTLMTQDSVSRSWSYLL